MVNVFTILMFAVLLDCLTFVPLGHWYCFFRNGVYVV